MRSIDQFISHLVQGYSGDSGAHSGALTWCRATEESESIRQPRSETENLFHVNELLRFWNSVDEVTVLKGNRIIDGDFISFPDAGSLSVTNNLTSRDQFECSSILQKRYNSRTNGRRLAVNLPPGRKNPGGSFGGVRLSLNASIDRSILRI